MHYRRLEQARVRNKIVLVRVGFDVPTSARGKVLDTFRLERTMPTIRWLISHRAKIVLLTHRGQPHGRRQRPLSVRPVVSALQRLARHPVGFCDLNFSKLRRSIDHLDDGEMLLVENLRFHLGEERASSVFARQLATCGDLYVNEDFSTSHRRHASMVLLPKLLPSFAGLNLVAELQHLDRLRNQPRRPFLAMIGGGKVRDKLSVIKELAGRVDILLLGGAPATTMLLAKGVSVGRSLVDHTVGLSQLRRLASQKNIELPLDVRVARSAQSTTSRVVLVEHLPTGFAAFDLGPQTIKRYASLIQSVRTLFWSGPVGFFENPRFAAGTMTLARSIARRTFAIAGGGDTLRALHQAKLAHRFTFLSTGGSAMLAYLAGNQLPGLQALSR